MSGGIVIYSQFRFKLHQHLGKTTFGVAKQNLPRLLPQTADLIRWCDANRCTWGIGLEYQKFMNLLDAVTLSLNKSLKLINQKTRKDVRTSTMNMK